MESRDAVFEALKRGRLLTSVVTGLQYILIEEKLHFRHSEKSEWKESGLLFDFPPSWLNLRDR